MAEFIMEDNIVSITWMTVIIDMMYKPFFLAKYSSTNELFNEKEIILLVLLVSTRLIKH